uniref:Uncharacterized protein n=1 Tax=Meloidogyne enterolobii TaxID=390850 RepID=A0A6V7XT71_MELEN|nr:unnamed protein product [Meloidogyne enterolobii]
MSKKIKILLFLLNIYLNFGLKNEKKYAEKKHLCLLENEQNSIYLSIYENIQKDSVLTILPIIGIPFGDKQNIKLKILNGQQFVSLNNSNKQLILKSEIDRDNGLSNINVLIECVPLIKYFNQSSEYSENIFSVLLILFLKRTQEINTQYINIYIHI